MNLHVFNPEHDLALAANNTFWTAPHAGRQLRADLGWLPALWAEDGDIILVDDVTAAEAVSRKMKTDIADVRFLTTSQLHEARDIDHIDVWGWDKSIVHQLKLHGIDTSLLPSPDTLAEQREFSDRATAAQLLSELRSAFPDETTGDAVSVSNTTDVTRLHKELGSIVLKAPWSSSGRGVRYLTDNNDNTMKWAEKVIRTQGHIMIEPLLNKVLDFGMEFTALEDGTVRYDGLSLFNTVNNAYEGSILATENEKLKMLSEYIPISLLNNIKTHICLLLSKNLNNCYSGPLGIDMMVVAPTLLAEKSGIGTTKALLQPCVEINLRRTMGHVALAISPKEDGHQQVMRIAYEGTNYHFRLYNDHEILF